MAQIKTERVDQQTRLTSRGDVVPVYRVTFFVDDHGPFYVEFNEPDFTTANIKAAQEKIAATIAGL